MLPFFRKIRWRFAANNQFLKYSRYAVGEIVLVVIGILIALQINNWNQERKDRKLASTYLHNIKMDMINDLNELENIINEVNSFEEEGVYSLRVIEGEIDSINKEKFLRSLIRNNYFHPFQPSRSTYDDLISSGNMKLIHDNDLKVALSKYYIENDWWVQFGERAKDTYWYVMREEIFKSVDPFAMKAFYESIYFPNNKPSIKLEDIKVDLEEIRTHESLRNAIARVLALRVWHKHRLGEAQDEINSVLNILKEY